MVVGGSEHCLDFAQGFNVTATECHGGIVLVGQLIAGAWTADAVDGKLFALRKSGFPVVGIGDHGAVFLVDHALGHCDHRNIVGDDWKNIFREPVDTEAADAA